MLSSPFSQSPMLPVTPRFPQKLWKIANECKTGAVSWSPDGKSILLRYSMFKEEFMSSKNDFFKTDNIASFVRQLNLYGFRKVYDNAHKQAYKVQHDLHEFSNVFFQRDRPHLLDKVSRKSSALKDKNELLPQSNKSMDFPDENSSDKWDNWNFPEKSKFLLCRNADGKKPDNRNIIRISQQTDEVKYPEQSPSITNKENIAPTEIPNVSSEQISDVPVKKKRGRKPGSKRKQNKAELIVQGNKIYYSPILKNPEINPELLHFKDDDDDNVFLRNTSKDVMLSSTLPFQESIEYRELRASYLRQCEMKMDTFRDYKSMFKIITPDCHSVE